MEQVRADIFTGENLFQHLEISGYTASIMVLFPTQPSFSSSFQGHLPTGFIPVIQCIPFLCRQIAGIIPFLALSLCLNGQSYIVNQSGTYSFESSNPISVSIPPDGITAIPIGFNFAFFGDKFTTCYVGENGFITFNSSSGGGCCEGQEIPDNSDPNNLIAAAWTDHNLVSVQYEVFGSQPTRRLVITLDLEDACGATYNGQVKFFESTNVIEIHTQSWAQSNPPCNPATQGIENAAGTVAISVSGRNSNSSWNVGSNDFVSFTPNVDYIVEQTNEYFFDYDDALEINIPEDGLAEVPIGFEFDFFGISYSDCIIGNNGFLTFGSTMDGGCCQGQNIPDPNTPNNLIAAAWMEVYQYEWSEELMYFNIYEYETIGTFPNRRFVVSYYIEDVFCASYYEGQIKLFETSNIIEIHTLMFAAFDTPCSPVTQGIENISGTKAFWFEGRNANIDWFVDCCDGEVVRFIPSTSLPQFDAGVASIVDDPFCEGTHMMGVKINNYGGQIIDSVEVHWSWNGVIQSPVISQADIPVGGVNFPVNVGNQNLVTGQTYTLKAWTSNPNDLPDENPLNDTMVATIKVGLHGNYTIGGAGPDYNTFGEALDDLEIFGICDTVTFLVRPGTYTEQILLTDIAGSEESLVTFTAENGDSASVILQFNAVSTSQNYLIRFDGGHDIIWERMTLNPLSSLYARVFEFINYSVDNTIRHCAINGENTTNSSTNFACIFSSSGNNNNKFYDNTIQHGSYGFYHSSSLDYPWGIEIKDNIFQDFGYRGIFTSRTTGIQMHGNVIESTKTSVRGIELAFEEGNVAISANKIKLTTGSVGIRLSSVEPENGVKANIFNNMVNVTNIATNTIGIGMYNCDFTNVFHNTVKLVSQPSSSSAYFQSGGETDSIFNNIFSNPGGGPAVSTNTLFSTHFDYNNYYSTGSILGIYPSGTSENLEVWQLVTGKDSNSISFDPLFLSTTDLHIENSFLNGAGSPSLSATNDIDNQVRNSTHPDIGADEFTPGELDAAISELLSPVPVCETVQNIEVVLVNLGADTINQVMIEWTINDQLQTPFLYTSDLLPEGDTAHIILESHEFNNQPVDFRFWTSMPNNGIDDLTFNDTLDYNYRMPLNGTYTIGGVSPDFTNMMAAVEAMQTFAICGPVVFQFRNGVYSGQIEIDSIPGSSQTNTVIFESESGDSSSVELTVTGLTSSNNYLVKIDNAEYCTFRNLKFNTSGNTSYNNIFVFQNNARHITIEGNSFIGRMNSTISGSIIGMTFGNDDFTIRNNIFRYGSQGVLASGSGYPARTQNLVIEDNIFFNQRNISIDVHNQRNFIIRSNKILKSIPNVVTFLGIDVSDVNEDNEISGNKITLNSGGNGMMINSANNVLGEPGHTRTFNNMVYTLNGMGIRLWNSAHAEISFNNVNSQGPDFDDYSFEIVGGDSNYIRNNIFVANAAKAFSGTLNNPLFTISDYNNLVSYGPNVGYWNNTNYPNLPSWQSGTSFDLNSMSIDPLFVSNIDLHVLSDTLNGAGMPIPGIVVDFDGDSRDLTNPDIGADEIGTEFNDAGIIQALPEMPFARGLQDIKAIIRNYGSNTLTTAIISWELNGVPQPDFYYGGELLSLKQDTVVLGQVDFELNIPYDIVVWSSLPNQMSDDAMFNDTVSSNSLYAAVSGNVVIGTTGELLTIGAAVTAMNAGGIIDSVHFKIQAGTYHESIVLQPSGSLSCDIPVVFESVTGNATDVIWDNMGTGTHTILMDSADGVQFHNLTIKTLVNAVQAIHFRNGSTCNLVNECIIEGVTTTNTSTSYAPILGISANSSTYNHNNKIQNSIFYKGSCSIYWDGFTGTTGLELRNNQFLNAYRYGVYAYRLKAPIVHGNIISTNTAATDFWGIYAQLCQDNSIITNNQVLMHGRRSKGIYLNDLDGTALLPVKVANNFMILGNGASSYGLHLNICTYTDVSFNTIRISGGANTGVNIYRQAGGNISILNNILDNQANGRTLLIDGTATPLTTDYNAHYTEGTNLVTYLGVNYTNLTAWQGTGRDLHSINEEPSYDIQAPLSFRITNASMNGTAIPVSGITNDIDNTQRDPLMPDIGCDEFNLFTHDVGLVAITNPHKPFATGLNTVYIKFVNNGVDTLTSMQVNWEINDIAQPGYYWTGLLPSAGTYDSLDIGEFNFAPGFYHKIKVWVSQPNAMNDGLASNDTLTVDSLYPALAGVYTIGGADPDFETLSEAVDELNKGGAADDVIFNIRSGTYLETLLLSDFPGSDCDREVIFQSETGNRSDVLITNLGINAYTVVLDGADGVTFQNISLESVNTAYRHVISYLNGAHCNHFINNIITGYESTSTAATSAVIHSASGLDTLNIFSGNHLLHGSYSFYLLGSSSALSRTSILDNIMHPYYSGIYADDEYGLHFNSNHIVTLSTNARGIYLNDCLRLLSISGNTIRIPSGQYGMHISGCDGLASSYGLISNNFVSVGGAGVARGVYMSGSEFNNVLNNNIHVYSTNTTAANTVPAYLSSCSSFSLANNVLSNSGTGYSIYSNNNTTFTGDHNAYYTTGVNLGYWNGTIVSDLTSWQSASGKDPNSLELDPQFMSDIDLHVSNILLNGAGLYQPLITDDIDNDSRNNPPDIGADEFDPSIANDAGVFMFMGPVTPFAHGPQPVSVALKNFGSDTLFSARIRWLVNGVEQPFYTWTGMLPPAQCDTISVGMFGFADHTGHDLLLWSELPNNIPDSTTYNDTLSVEELYPSLTGTYSVGGLLPDFNLFSQLERALNLGGIIGNVTFAIRNGIYVAQLKIEDFPRSSSSYDVRFTSESGDSSLVTLIRNFNASSDDNYTVRLDNASGIQFDKITIASTKGKIVDLINGSRHIEITNCKLTGVPLTSNSSNYQLIYSGTTTEDNILITNNRFEFGNDGIYFQASPGDPEEQLIISGNTFYNCYTRAIYARYHHGLQVNNNIIRNTQNRHQGIVILNGTGSQSISGNDIRLLAGGSYGISIYEVDGTSLNPVMINNNYILARDGGTTNTYGINQESVDFVNYNYNTVRIENTGSGSAGFRDQSSYNNIHIRNSNFANYGGGKTMHVAWSPTSNTNTINYCNLYSDGPVLATWFYDYADLASLQANTTQNQNSVSSEPLFSDEEPDVFQADLDGGGIPVPGITTDIRGVTRHASTPDIGVVEFVLPAHDIGAKLLASPVTYCGLSNAEEITIRIQNFGASVETGFDVAYSMNGGAWNTENIGSLNLLPGKTLDFTFSLPQDMSVPGDYQFDLSTHLLSDLNGGNDTITGIIIEHIPVLTSPVSNMIPLDGAVDLDKTVSLSWMPAENATVYDIYIWPDGSSQPGTPQVADLDQINTLYSQLNYGLTYSWLVVAKNVCDQMVSSPEQQFSVRELPDLVIDTVIAPATAFSGQEIEIEWQVVNDGLGSTNDQLWSDAIYLSSDATLNISYDIYLGAVQNLTALDDGISYTNSGMFTVPNGFVGNYYVFVYADKWKNVIEENDNNNWDRISTPMAVSLTPAPDLIVVSVTTPTTAFSGEDIPVTYTVKNNGTGSVPVNVIWKDRLVFGTDPLNPIGTYLNTIQSSGQLLPDSTYQVMVMANIPAAVQGIFYMHVHTDYLNQVYEFSAENNNSGVSVPIEVILSPPPDLVIMDLDFQDTVSNNENIILSFEVMNQGAGEANGTYWFDQVYISQSPVYNSNFLIPLSGKYYYQALPANESYIVSLPVKIPYNIGGAYYLYVHTDQKQKLFEFNMENNNIYRSPGQIWIQKADIIPDAVVIPDTVEADTYFALAWDRINLGPGSIINRNVRAKIYVSTVDTIDASAVLVQNINKLVAGLHSYDTLHEAVTLRIPPQFSQNVYLLLQEDADNQVHETPSGELNNLMSIPVFVSPGPVPDIFTSEISVPDTVIAGSEFNIEFLVVNQGTKAVLSPWNDRVFFSFDPVWNPEFATEITTVQQGNPFIQGDTRNFSFRHIFGSNTVENIYYIYVISDMNDQIYEGVAGELNNIQRSAPFYIKETPPIDLRMDTVTTGVTTFYSGYVHSFEYKVINNSIIPLSTVLWTDRAFLSTDSIFSANDIQLNEFGSSGSGLIPGGIRTSNRLVSFPNGISGIFYVLFVTDADNVQNDPNRANNVNTIRNPLGQAVSINIILSPSPDFSIQLFNTSSTGIAGQPLDVIYKIANAGNGPAYAWLDKLYLSTDNAISQNDVLLFSNSVIHPLPVGVEFQDTVEVMIPALAFGNYILILQVDAPNTVYEHNGENNNILTRAIEIISPPPSDLEIGSLIVPVNVIAGENIGISWTTSNTGDNPASGIFREVVYISPDSIWDIDDRVFGFRDDQIYLNPGGAREASLTENIIGVATGDYYAIVQTDARHNFVESDEDNNFTNSPDVMKVDVKTLVIDSLTADTLNNNIELYYKLIIGPELDGETIILDLKGDSLSGLNELFVKYEQMPTRADFDHGFENPFSANQRLILPDVEPGVYYILSYGYSILDTLQPITLHARVIDYEILSVSPDKGTQNTQVTIKVVGAKLSNTLTARLRHSNPWIELIASSVLQVSDNLLYITFDLTDVPIDTYAIDLIKTDSSLAYLDGFLVLPDGGHADIQLKAHLPGGVPSRNVPVHIILTYINNGDADYINPAAIVEAPYGNLIAFSLEDLKNGIGESALRVPLIEENGPSNILRPGASGRIELYAWSNPKAVYGIRKEN